MPQLAENRRTAVKARIKRASKAAQADLHRLDAVTQAQVKTLYEQAVAAIQADIANYAGADGGLRLQTLQRLETQLNSRLAALAQSRDELLGGGLARAAGIGAGQLAGEISADLGAISDEAVRAAVRFTGADGLQLSDRLWRVDQGARESLARAVQGAIVRGQSASAAVDEYLARGEAAPADLVRAAGAGKASAVQKAAGEALMTGKMSARAQAMRVFRTEINRAHGLAFQAAAFEHPDVVGTRFLLSPAHPEPDICDMHASVNRYGLGAGVYPRGKSPWPAHPNTLSFEEVVFEDEVTEEDRAGKETRIDWLERQGKGLQAAVLGINKARALRAGLLTENAIATPWSRLKAKLEGKLGVDPGEAADLRAALAREQARRAQENGAALTSDVAEAQKAAAKAEAAAALAERVAKAQQLAATLKLDAIKPGVGWPGKALEKLQAGDDLAGLSPVEQLAKVETLAKELAEKKALQSAKAKAKAAMIAGKPVPPAGQAWLDQADPDELAELQQLVDAAKAEKAAEAALAAISPGQGYDGKALAKLKAAGALDGLPAVQQLAKVEALAGELQSLKALQSAKAKAKAAMIAGKPVPPAGQSWLDQADPDELAELMADVEAAKIAAATKAATANPGGPLRFEDFEQIGPQGGSNPGALYQHRASGDRWYIKTPASAELARNEVLAAELYRAAGVDMPELRLIDVDGRQGVASRIVDGVQKDKAALTRGRVSGVQEHLAVDAWLANWDVVGLGYDNLLVKGGRAFRIDTGGALRFRAQGGAKGQAWGPAVPELDSLRDAGMNPQAASVFKHATQADIEAGVGRVLAVRRETIEALLEQFGPLDLGERRRLLDTLLARQATLAKRYPHLVKGQAVGESASGAGALSDAELDVIRAARVNGVQVDIDGGDIEDHALVVSQMTDADGGELLRAWLKLRPDAGAKVAERIREKAVGGISYGTLDNKLLTAIKGLAHRDGQDLRSVDLERITAAREEFARVGEQLKKALEAGDLSPQDALAFASHYEPWLRALDEAARPGVGGKFSWKAPAAKFAGAPAPRISGDQGGRWERVSGPVKFEIAELSRSHARFTGRDGAVPGTSEWFRLETDTLRATYIPHGAGNNFTMEGFLKIDAKGGGAPASAEVFKLLQSLEIDSRRTAPEMRRELYLDKSAYVITIRDPRRWREYQALAEIEDQAQRMERKLALVNQWAGRDISATPEWERAEGQRQAFGHGRSLQFRADLDPGEFQRFARSYGLYHNPTGLGIGAGAGVWDRLKRVIEGGGMFSSQADRVRRGIDLAGSSVSADFSTGGANYFYTRIQPKSRQDRTAGVWFKAEAIRRLDAISYRSDSFGRSTEDYQRSNRIVDVAGWRDASKIGSNETIFRDGVSLFDDVDRIVLSSRAEQQRAIADMREMGYSEWPDGRSLEEVLTY